MEYYEIDKKLEKLKESRLRQQAAWLKFQEALEETRRIIEEVVEELARVDSEESSIKTPDGHKKGYISKDGRLHWRNSDDVAEIGEKISGGSSEDREPGGDA